MTRTQVREIDRRSLEDYHIPGIVLMENAARSATDAALDLIRGVDRPGVLIVCGGGNNGGDGLAVARHLHNRGVDVNIALAVDPDHYRGDALVNRMIADAMALPHVAMHDAAVALGQQRIHLVIDALFGTGLESLPRDTCWIELMNRHDIPVLSVDLPSGLDCDTGDPLGPVCVRATRTVTFVAEKAGFTNPRGRQYLGEVIVGDIGCPRELIEAVASAPPAASREAASR